MAWPSSRAMRRPAPSLPVAGTERPPVARMTRAARIISPDESCTAQQSSSRSRSVTRAAVHTRPPRWTYAVISASSTVRARSLTGKSLPVSASSLSGTPRSASKKRRTSASGQAASTFRTRFGRAIADEIGVRRLAGEHVAAPAAADQDLLAGAIAALQQQHGTRAGRGMDRGHQARRARADDYNRLMIRVAHCSRPRFAAEFRSHQLLRL